jgi:hypothetical protein
MMNSEVLFIILDVINSVDWLKPSTAGSATSVNAQQLAHLLSSFLFIYKSMLGTSPTPRAPISHLSVIFMIPYICPICLSASISTSKHGLYPKIKTIAFKLIDSECLGKKLIDFLSAEEVGLVVSLRLTGVVQLFPELI